MIRRISFLVILPLCLLCLLVTGYAQTDITNSGGTITAQYTDSPSGEEIAKLIDNNTNTKYLTFHGSGWVQFQASAGAVVTSYTITSANDAAERDPKNFNLQGSNNGSTWTTLNTQSNQTFASRFLKKTYTFSNSTSYTYYRLNVTAVQSGTTMQMAEWELLAGSTPPTGVVTVYKDCPYGGASQGYAVGTYTTAQMVAKGTVNNDVSSVKVTSGYKVTFYDSDNFTGTSVVKTADDDCLVDDSFNDMASSMKVETSSGTPDYTLSASPSSLSIAQGGSGTSTITVNKLNGFSSSVSLSASGLPGGVTASFNPTSTTGTSTLTLTASSSATVGTSTVTITGTSGSLTHTTTVSLTVTSSGTNVATVYQHCDYGGYAVGLAAGSYTLAQLQAKGVTDNDLSSVKVNSGYKVTLYDSDNYGGTSVVVTADITCLTSNSFNDMATSIKVETNTGTPDFSLSRSPSSLTINQGASGTSTITVNKVNGFNSSVSLSASGMGTGVTASFNPTSTTGTSILTLTASSSAATGTRTVTVTGVSGSLTHTTTISLTVNTSGGDVGKTWQENWFDHTQLLTCVYSDANVRVWYDPDMNRSITWQYQYTSDLWAYINAHYGPHAGGNSGGKLDAVFHQGRHQGGTMLDYFDAHANYHNVTDVGTDNWSSSTGWNLDATTHEAGHIVEACSYNSHESPAWDVWGDSKWCEIFLYDAYVGLGKSGDASRVYNEFTSSFFRDWFYPIWTNYGGTTVLARFFELLSQHFPKSGNMYDRRMNLGEFVYFYSGACGTSQKARATTAFGWTSTTNSQWNQAYNDFPGISFSGKDADAAVAPAPVAPITTCLNSVSPNPCINTATIKYQLKTAGKVKMMVYNALGQQVATLVDDRKSAGPQTINWNVQNVSGGVYYIKLQAGNTVSTQKAIVAK